MAKSTNTTDKDYKLTVGDMISEQMYWVKRKITMWARGVLYMIMPNWLVREAFMYAQRYIADDEIVPEVEFMAVFKRVCENDVMRGTRVTK
jgi:hypothetical protein